MSGNTTSQRSAAEPVALETRPRGFCTYWDGVFIKANGRIPCGSDHGESHTMTGADLEVVDFVPEVLNGPAFRDMRIRTVLGNRAFLDCCRRCAAFRPLDPDFRAESRNPHYPASDAQAAGYLYRVHAGRGWPLGSIDSIGNLHLEPSLACTLKCPACLHGFDADLLRREGLPYSFSLQRLEAITRSLTVHGVTVRRIGFGGRGEPTLNRRLPELIRHCCEACPDALLEMDTNAQHGFNDELLLLDALYCSIDGSTRGSYETYRIGGSFERSLAFLQTATERKRALHSSCKIVWKYILFDTTESIKLLDRAQCIAKEFRVDELLFVITWTAGTNGKVFPPGKMKTLADVDAYLRSRPIFPRVRVKYQ